MTYPALEGIEDRYGPTPVHLQVYDGRYLRLRLLAFPHELTNEHQDAAHVLPVLFPFATPSRYCYRAIAAFCKHVTGIPLDSPLSTPGTASPFSTTTTFGPKATASPGSGKAGSSSSPSLLLRKTTMRRTVSSGFVKVFRRMSSHTIVANGDVGGGTQQEPSLEITPNGSNAQLDSKIANDPRLAGDPIVYSDAPVRSVLRPRPLLL
jgi:hypothetical protein